MASRLGLSYDTVYKAVTTIRLAVAAHAEDTRITAGGEEKTDRDGRRAEKGGDRRRGPAVESPVFGLREHQGRVLVQVMPGYGIKTILDLPINKARWGSTVYTDPYGGFDSLMSCSRRRGRIDPGARFSKGPVRINGLEGFWSYAKERLLKYRGVTPGRFPLYLKELEFRYNHRNEDIFPTIVRFLCDLKPQKGNDT